MEIAKFVNKLIINGARIGVSDIHFKPDRTKVEIYVRLDGVISYQKEITHSEYRLLLRYIKYKSKLDLGLCQNPQDGSYTIETAENEIFVRVSTIPLIYSESLVIRILTDKQRSDRFAIALHPSDLQQIYDQIVKATGLFVFTGPTGSGKSTSMYALLEKAATEANKKVICIEDPVEVINHNFTQIQINENAGLTYANCLKACLRHDPDIMMIGEIRDEETAKQVVRASLTGHTVISTMHTKNKYGVIERFLDFDFKISEINSILIGISNQRLILDKQGQSKAFYDFVVGSQVLDLIEHGEVLTIQDKMTAVGLSANKQ
ncbi:competence type IV pilus ATPase ComGA [Mollicutes bacterium LVI A0039]|nr:competence type IV pilus ATPase ComGA [Mollicutes bacterium LVI A0039]